MGHLEPIRHEHLNQVADLLEAAFRGVMDDEGRVFIQRLRREARSWFRRPGRAGWLEAFGMWGWVWLEEGRVVGHVAVVPTPREGEYVIVNVAVHEHWRGRGIGRLLVQAALEHLLRLRARRAWLEMDEGNAPARRLYTGLGFGYVATRWRWHLASAARPVASGESPARAVRPLTPSAWKGLAPHFRRWYPWELDWRFPTGDLSLLFPGLWPWVRRTFRGIPVQAWYVGPPKAPRAALFWLHMPRRARQWLFLAPRPRVGLQDLAPLLRPIFPRSQHLRFVLDAPQGALEAPLQRLGFALRRRLEVWTLAF